MENTINKEDLSHMAKAVEIMQYTMQEILEEFFTAYDSKDATDWSKIVWEFNRNRARVTMIDDYLLEMRKILEEHGIVYWGSVKRGKEADKDDVA